MARAGLGARVSLIAVAEGGSVGQPRQPAGEMRAIFVEQVCRQLVDRNHYDQLRWPRWAVGTGGCSAEAATNVQ